MPALVAVLAGWQQLRTVYGRGSSEIGGGGNGGRRQAAGGKSSMPKRQMGRLRSATRYDHSPDHCTAVQQASGARRERDWPSSPSKCVSQAAAAMPGVQHEWRAVTARACKRQFRPARHAQRGHLASRFSAAQAALRPLQCPSVSPGHAAADSRPNYSNRLLSPCCCNSHWRLRALQRVRRRPSTFMVSKPAASGGGWWGHTPADSLPPDADATDALCPSLQARVPSSGHVLPGWRTRQLAGPPGRTGRRRKPSGRPTTACPRRWQRCRRSGTRLAPTCASPASTTPPTGGWRRAAPRAAARSTFGCSRRLRCATPRTTWPAAPPRTAPAPPRCARCRPGLSMLGQLSQSVTLATALPSADIPLTDVPLAGLPLPRGRRVDGAEESAVPHLDDGPGAAAL